MCLSKITNENPEKTGTGYKVFFEDSRGRLKGEIQGDNLKLRPYNRWLLAIDFSNGIIKPLMSDAWEPYSLGWHIFADLKSARIWVENNRPNLSIKKVKYRNALVRGHQVVWNPEPTTKKSIRGDVIVANEIYIYKMEIK